MQQTWLPWTIARIPGSLSTFDPVAQPSMAMSFDAPPGEGGGGCRIVVDLHPNFQSLRILRIRSSTSPPATELAPYTRIRICLFLVSFVSCRLGIMSLSSTPGQFPFPKSRPFSPVKLYQGLKPSRLLACPVGATRNTGSASQRERAWKISCVLNPQRASFTSRSWSIARSLRLP